MGDSASIPEERPDELSDEALLDEAFEAFVAARSEGTALDWRSFAVGREPLEPELRELWSLACSMTAARVRTRRIGDYELLRELGRGAMGVVHLAAQESLGGRHVALKVLGAATTVSARDRARFLAEAHALARVKHANVVEIFDVLEDPAHIAFAMEWIEGGSLADLCDARAADAGRAPFAGRSRLSSEQRAMQRREFVPYLCRVGVAIGRALEAAHAAGLTHRDVKPSNILLRPDGTPVLSDFGLVRDEHAALRTQSGVFLGTLAFAPPEQLRGEPLDARADIYSLACTLYYALTATLPHAGSSQLQLLRSIEQGRCRPLRRLAPDLPRDLETVLAKGLEAEPAARYASAAEFADDLDRILALQPIRGKRPGVVARAVQWVRRQRRGLAAAAVGAAATAALVGWWVGAEQRARRRAERIESLLHDARLTLLDTELERRVRLGLRFGDPALIDVVVARSGAALALYDEAATLDGGRADIRLERGAVIEALTVLRGGRTYPERTLALDATEDELRARGLFAYVTGDVRSAVDAWQRLEGLGPSDPLLSALLGHAQLAAGRPELAYARLARAADEFQGAGFLQVSAARAALLCGDTEVAARLVQRARSAGVPESDAERLAVEADLAWVQGDASAALASYERAALDDAYLRGAEDAVRRGALEEAVFAFGTLVSNAPEDWHVRREFLRHTRRWWASLDGVERRAVLAQGLRGERRELGYVFGVLTQVAAAIELIGARAEGSAGVPAFVLRGADALFERDVRDRLWTDDSLDALTERIDVRAIDLERVIELESIHPRLVESWLAGDAERAAEARDLLAQSGAILSAPRTSFGPVHAPLPPHLHLVAEVEGLAISFATMWNCFQCAMGDVDGDGRRDFLIGCSATEDQPARAGRLCALSGEDGRLIWQRVGEAYDDLAVNVCLVGDADGDGVLDVLVDRSRLTGEQATPLALVSGASGRVLRGFESALFDGEPTHRFTAIGTAREEAPSGAPATPHTAGAPAPTFAVGLPGLAGGHGAVRAFDVDGRALWTTRGRTISEGLGTALANVGDLDGDGVDDLLAGCPAGSEVTVLSGATGALLGRRDTSRFAPVARFPLAADARSERGPWLPLPTSADGVEAIAVLADFALAGSASDANAVHRSAAGPAAPRRLASAPAANEGFGIFTESLGDLDGDGLSEVAVSSLAGRSPRRPRVRIYSSRGGCLAELPGFIWVRRLGLDPLLPEPKDKRLVTIGLDAWSRYADRPVGGPARVVLLEYRD